jgi:putative hydrolase of the HAD superfamily
MSEAMRALILDFGGVISRTVFEMHDVSERALGLAPGTLRWRGPFDVASDPLWSAMQSGTISERDYWYERAKETGKLVGEEDMALPEFLQRTRGNDPNVAIRAEALEAIDTVKKAGHKLGILSNELDLFYGSGFRAKLPFLSEFDTIVDATYTGILKPDARAYLSVAEALHLPPEACVFVDDQIKNVRGAEAVGMVAIHFDVLNPALGYATALQQFGLELRGLSHA